MTSTTDPPLYSDKSAEVSESSPHLDPLAYHVAGQDMASPLGVCCLSRHQLHRYMACLRPAAACLTLTPGPGSRVAMHGSVHLPGPTSPLSTFPAFASVRTTNRAPPDLGQSAPRRKLPDKSRASRASVESCSPPVKSAGMVSMAGMMSCSDSSYVMSMPNELPGWAPLLGTPFTARE